MVVAIAKFEGAIAESTLPKTVGNMAKDIVTLNRNGFEVEFSRDDLVSLTKLWKMAGSPEKGKPNDWLAIDKTQELVSKLVSEVITVQGGNKKKAKSRVLQTTRGRNGETQGHYKLALEYSGYLSIEFKSWMLGIIGELIEAPEDFAANILINSHNKEKVERAKQRVLVSGTNKQTMELASITGTPYAQVHNDRYRGLYRMNAKELRTDGGLDKAETPLDALSTYDLTLNSLANQRAKMMGNPNAIFAVANTLREGHEKDMGSPLKPTWEEKRLRPNQAKAIAYSPEYQTELPVS